MPLADSTQSLWRDAQVGGDQELGHTSGDLRSRLEEPKIPLAGALLQKAGRAFLTADHGKEKTPFEVVFGQHFFDFLEQDDEARTLFSGAMANITRFCTPYLALVLVLRPLEGFLDVGGGDGELARALARRYPKNALAVMDRTLTDTSLCGNTPNYVFHQGDFFQEVPTGYDHIGLKNILHDWDDPKAVAILRNCREAVRTGARLTIINTAIF